MNKILVFPEWRDNPYLNMLYVGARAEGWVIQGATSMGNLPGPLSKLSKGDVFHIHWTSPVCQVHATHASARSALEGFRRAVSDALERGVRLVWTVHNAVSHACRYLDLEVELAEFLASAAWRIIQLNPHTTAAVAHLYALPVEKLATLRHASYIGVYPPAPSKDVARASLGVPSYSPTVGFIGQIRPYKGLTTLLSAVDLAAKELDNMTLLLAGKADAGQIGLLDHGLPIGVRTIRQHTFVPDGELGRWFAAADVIALPYERILNSGSLMLAASFARPCILPGEPHLVAQYGDQSWVSFYDPLNNPAESLCHAIIGSLAENDDKCQAAREFAEAYTTADMAWDYVRLITQEQATTARNGSVE